MDLGFVFFMLFVGIIWFFAAFIFGYICVCIMRNKGYDSLGKWFFLGFCLLIIGFAICLSQEDRIVQMQAYGQPVPPGQPMPPYPNQPMMDQQPMGIRCNACGSFNAPDAVYCRKCSSKIQ